MRLFQTVPTDRQVAGDTTVTLAEQGAGKPDVLLKWFYPGNETGHEFVYSHDLEKQIAQDRQQTLGATDSEAGGSN